jgi:hypothetical protein
MQESVLARAFGVDLNYYMNAEKLARFLNGVTPSFGQIPISIHDHTAGFTPPMDVLL